MEKLTKILKFIRPRFQAILRIAIHMVIPLVAIITSFHGVARASRRLGEHYGDLSVANVLFSISLLVLCSFANAGFEKVALARTEDAAFNFVIQELPPEQREPVLLHVLPTTVYQRLRRDSKFWFRFLDKIYVPLCVVIAICSIVDATLFVIKHELVSSRWEGLFYVSAALSMFVNFMWFASGYLWVIQRYVHSITGESDVEATEIALQSVPENVLSAFDSTLLN